MRLSVASLYAIRALAHLDGTPDRLVSSEAIAAAVQRRFPREPATGPARASAGIKGR